MNEPNKRIYTRWTLTDMSSMDSVVFVSHYKLVNEIKKRTGEDVTKVDHVTMYDVLRDHNLLVEWKVSEINDYSGYNTPKEF